MPTVLRMREVFDELDDAERMAEETRRIYFRRFTTDMIAIRGARYLCQRPHGKEREDVFEDYKDAGFTRCDGVIHCIKLGWKNCPLAHKGQYHYPREGKLATIPAEAWCDCNTYIWHWYIGRTGTKNDINVMINSSLMQGILSGVYWLSTGMEYKIVDNSLVRVNLYFLADGIYPEWVIFAKPIHHPTTYQ